MRRPTLVRGLVGAGLLCAVGLATADAREDPEARALRWALTHAPLTAATREQVRAIVAQAPADALDRLLSLGEPARRALMRIASEDEAVAARVRPWLARLQAEEDAVEATGLASSIPGLLARGAAAAARARSIAPTGAPEGWGISWWAERTHAYRFVPALSRFVAWEAWPSDAAPLRLHGRDRVVLEGTAGMVRWDSPTTVEFWVRWPHRTSAQYLLTDEAWPEMAPDVLPTATKRGFALRRNGTGDGRASLDLTFATAPNHWFSIESPPLAIRDDWEHVAVSSDGGVVRLFRNGILVAARSLVGVRLLPGMGDLTIGAREHGLANRAAEFDLRALRITEGTRYTDDFVPAQVLPADDATILSPDFTPGREHLGDRAARGRRHEITGARWVPALDAAAIRDAVARFGGGARDPLVFEADRGGRSADWYLAPRDGQSEGYNVEIWSQREPDERGHRVSVLVRIAAPGRYRVYALGAGLEHLGADGMASPFSWRFDDADATVVSTSQPTIRAVGGRWDAALSPLGDATLSAGEHVFHLRLLARRAHDDRYSLWLDAIVLEPTQ